MQCKDSQNVRLAGFDKVFDKGCDKGSEEAFFGQALGAGLANGNVNLRKAFAKNGKAFFFDFGSYWPRWIKLRKIKLMQNEKPIHNVRLGVIKAAIWKNEKENAIWYNVKFERGYKDGNEWKTSESFGRDDLLLLAKVADQAHTWICERTREDNAERAKPATANRP